MASRSVASRRHKPWESRYRSGMPQRDDASGKQRVLGEGTGWEVLSYLLAGMAAYGGIGWLIGHAVHVQILFPIGMLVGAAISLGWIVHRFGRQ
jgi:ATP synthase protein I